MRRNRGTGVVGLAAVRRCGRPAARGGFSLLEVLISMFVLTIGLLGVAALIPIANLAIARTAVADRAAACGRAGMREVRVREWLNPNLWIQPGRPSVPIDPFAAYCIDPMYLSRMPAGAFPAAYTFPFDLGGIPLKMHRVSLNLPIAPASQVSVFDDLFTWHDDLVIDRSGDARPRLLFATDTGQSVPFPRRAGDTPTAGTILNEAEYGDYSWMITVTPAPSTVVTGSPGPGLIGPSFERFAQNVSIVVYRKRNLLEPTNVDNGAPVERVVRVNFLGTGTGGGDVRLTFDNTAGYDPYEYLSIHEGEWMLVCGNLAWGLPNQPPRNVFLWYRVISTGEIINTNNNQYARELTLAGPDWSRNWSTNSDTDGDGIPFEAQGVLVNNVVGVYTETVEADYQAPWSTLPQ